MSKTELARLAVQVPEIAELRRDAARFQYLQNCDPKVAQAYFWNYQSRKQRVRAIDDDMAVTAIFQPAALPGQAGFLTWGALALLACTVAILCWMERPTNHFPIQTTGISNEQGGNTEKQSGEYDKQFIMISMKPIPRSSESISDPEKNRAVKSGTLVLIGLLIGGMVAYFIINYPFEKRNKDETDKRDD